MLYSIDFMSSFLSVIATVFPAAMLRLPRTNFYLVYSVRMRLIIFFTVLTALRNHLGSVYWESFWGCRLQRLLSSIKE